MSATDIFEAELLSLIFENDNIDKMGDATGVRGSATAGNFRISLHLADAVSDSSTIQTDNEASYGAYTRKSIARSTAGWTVTGTAPTQVRNDAAITFPEATSGSNTVTDFGLGELTSGAGEIWIYGSLTSDLIISDGITPEFAINALSININ